MRDPEFEKHVQKKLEELEFDPSANVWKKVEEEIKKDKKRRIPLLWIFLLSGLLLSGTYWIFFTQKNGNERNIAVNKINEVKSEKVNAADSQISDKNLIEADKKNDKQSESDIQQQTLGNEKRNLAEKKSVPFISKNEKIKSEKNKAKDLQVGDESKNEKVKSKKNKAADSQIEKIKNKNENSAGNDVVVNNKNEKIKSKEIKAADSQIEDEKMKNKNEDGAENDVVVNNKNEKIKNKEIKAADSQIEDESKNENEKNKNINAADSQVSKSSVSDKIKTKKENPLQLGFTAGIGSSGVNNILGSSYFAPANSFNTAPGFPAVHNPSSIQSDLSFYAGIFLKKSFSKRISLSAGLNYHYYSTKIRTGDAGDSVVYVYPSAYSLSAAVPQAIYYRSGSTHNYTNHFHFIEMPVLMNIQLNSNQKLPIIWQAGFSLSYLLHTDALQFDPVSGVYYKNNSAFNKTQVNAITGFAIGFYKNKNLIQVGPEIQYGLTNILQSNLNTKQHFFYGGLKLSLIPQKK
jgi:hypothetical protein